MSDNDQAWPGASAREQQSMPVKIPGIVQIQRPIRRFNHLASLHEFSHCDPLVEVLLLIGQEQHRETFAGASASNADVRTSPVRVIDALVRAETLNCPVAGDGQFDASHEIERFSLMTYSPSLRSRGQLDQDFPTCRAACPLRDAIASWSGGYVVLEL